MSPTIVTSCTQLRAGSCIESWLSLAETYFDHAENMDVIVKNDINRWQECDLKQMVPRSASGNSTDKVATFAKQPGAVNLSSGTNSTSTIARAYALFAGKII